MSTPAPVAVPELVYHPDGSMALADNSPGGVQAATRYLAQVEPGARLAATLDGREGHEGAWFAAVWHGAGMTAYAYGPTRREAEAVAVAHVLADHGLAGVVGDSGITVTAPATFTADDLAALVPVVARA